MKAFLILLCLFSVGFVIAPQGQIRTDKLDSLFEELHQRQAFNGNVIVARSGEILYQRSFGYADATQQQTLNDSSVFELASVSKQFTAMGIMLLEARDLLDYDDFVSDYIEDFPYPSVTIRYLLQQRSGIPDYLAYGEAHWDPEKIGSNADVIAYYQTEQPALSFPAGSQFQYANINYVLLAEIIKIISHASYQDFLHEYIFEPLQMTQTRSYTTRWAEGEMLENYAMPMAYDVSSNSYREAWGGTEYPLVAAASGIEGDGSIVSSGPDLVRWEQALRENTLLSADQMAVAYTPAVLPDGSRSEYGFGIYLDPKRNKAWHWGGWAGVQTSFVRYLDSETVAIYLKNVENHDWSWLGRFEKLVR
ncbi:MAG: serine hydrolase domain-containing protein [Bacteroidota bacterium]